MFRLFVIKYIYFMIKLSQQAYCQISCIIKFCSWYKNVYRERGGLMVERQTPEREVGVRYSLGGAVLCP